MKIAARIHCARTASIVPALEGHGKCIRWKRIVLTLRHKRATVIGNGDRSLQ